MMLVSYGMSECDRGQSLGYRNSTRYITGTRHPSWNTARDIMPDAASDAPD